MSKTASKPVLLGPGCTYLRPELSDMKVIGVEEHMAIQEPLNNIRKTDEVTHVIEILKGAMTYSMFEYPKGRADNFGPQRLQDMDDGGIAVQILSFSGPLNTTHMDPQAGLEAARQINGQLKRVADGNPGRCYVLAELPFQAPQLAIEELHRCINELGFVGAMLSGSVGGNGKFLDDPEFDGILSAFEDLDVPLFLHPGIAPKNVVDAYYTMRGKPELTANLTCFGWGWHNEVAIHVLRLAVSGTLDRHPKLKILTGHSGEMMPAMLHRFDQMFEPRQFGLKRSVGEILRSQVWLSISGLFSVPATLIAIQAWGVDRILFGNDYPFIDAQSVPAFLRALGDVVAPSDLRKICQTNSEALFKIKA